MGIKRSDSITNFYDIEGIIGRGAFGEVVKAKHLFSNEYRAIKMIEKKKIAKHSVLMQLQVQELNVLMEAVSY
jgi:serine/threonine protein kinase